MDMDAYMSHTDTDTKAGKYTGAGTRADTEKHTDGQQGVQKTG